MGYAGVQSGYQTGGVLGQGQSTSFIMDLSVVGLLDSPIFTRARGAMTAATTDTMKAEVIAGNRLRCIRIGGTGNIPTSTVYYPRTLQNNLVQGVAQYCEGRLLSQSATDVRVGPGVLLSSDEEVNLRGYILATQGNPIGTVRLIRCQPNGAQTVLVSTLGWAANDKLRLEVTPSTNGGADHTLRYYRNGTLLGTFVDNSIQRPANGSGWPAWMLDAILLPANSEDQ